MTYSHFDPISTLNMLTQCGGALATHLDNLLSACVEGEKSIRGAIAVGDRQMLITTAHKLRGSLMVIKAEPARTLTRAVEMLMRSGAMAIVEIAQLLGELMREMAALRREFADFRKRIAGADTVEVALDAQMGQTL
jgi:HPt (histidine-containing phosphotransfer) domain-containing protein